MPGQSYDYLLTKEESYKIMEGKKNDIDKIINVTDLEKMFLKFII